MTRPIALITGAGSGIGAAIAVQLARRCDLILTHLHNDQDLADVRTAAGNVGAEIVAVTGDLTNPATIDAVGAAVAQAGDRLDTFISNAGAYPRTHWRDLDLATVRHQLEVNLVTHVACAKLVTPVMTARGRGSIVAMSSVLTQLGRTDLAPTSPPRAAWKGSFAHWHGNSARTE
jgi:NAD(P)-dependent dehydrogenase (short-subunit alcohol dehydrogenase family)